MLKKVSGFLRIFLAIQFFFSSVQAQSTLVIPIPSARDPRKFTSDAEPVFMQNIARFSLHMLGQRLEVARRTETGEIEIQSTEALDGIRPLGRASIYVSSVHELDFSFENHGRDLVVTLKREAGKPIFHRHIISHFDQLSVRPNVESGLESPLLHFADQTGIKTFSRHAKDLFFNGAVPVFQTVAQLDPESQIESIEAIDFRESHKDLLAELGLVEMVQKADLRVTLVNRLSGERKLYVVDRNQVLAGLIPVLNFYLGSVLLSGISPSQGVDRDYAELGAALGVDPKDIRSLTVAALEMQEASAHWQNQIRQNVDRISSEAAQKDPQLLEAAFAVFREQGGLEVLKKFNPKFVQDLQSTPRTKMTGAEAVALFQGKSLLAQGQRQDLERQILLSGSARYRLQAALSGLLGQMLNLTQKTLNPQTIGRVSHFMIDNLWKVLKSPVSWNLATMGVVVGVGNSATDGRILQQSFEFLMSAYHELSSHGMVEALSSNIQSGLHKMTGEMGHFSRMSFQDFAQWGTALAFVMGVMPLTVWIVTSGRWVVRNSVGEKVEGLQKFVTVGIKILVQTSRSIMAVMVEKGLRQKNFYATLDQGRSPFRSIPGEARYSPEGLNWPWASSQRIREKANLAQARNKVIQDSAPLMEYMAALMISYLKQNGREKMDVTSIAVVAQLQASFDKFHDSDLGEKAQLTRELLLQPETSELWMQTLPSIRRMFIEYINDYAAFLAENPRHQARAEDFFRPESFDAAAVGFFIQEFDRASEVIRSEAHQDVRSRFRKFSELSHRLFSRQILAGIIYGNSYRKYYLEHRGQSASPETTHEWWKSNGLDYFISMVIGAALFPVSHVMAGKILWAASTLGAYRPEFDPIQISGAATVIAMAFEQTLFLWTIATAGVMAANEQTENKGDAATQSRLREAFNLGDAPLSNLWSRASRQSYAQKIESVAAELAPILQHLPAGESFNLPRGHAESYTAGLGRAIKSFSFLPSPDLENGKTPEGIKQHFRSHLNFTKKLTGPMLQAYLIIGAPGIFLGAAASLFSNYGGVVPLTAILAAVPLAILMNFGIILIKYSVKGYAFPIPYVHKVGDVISSGVQRDLAAQSDALRKVNEGLRFDDSTKLHEGIQEIFNLFKKTGSTLPSKFDKPIAYYSLEDAASLANYLLQNPVAATRENKALNFTITASLYSLLTVVLYFVLYKSTLSIVNIMKESGSRAALDAAVQFNLEAFMWLGLTLGFLTLAPAVIDYARAVAQAYRMRKREKMESEQMARGNGLPGAEAPPKRESFGVKPCRAFTL